MGSVGSPVSSTAPNPNDIITSYNNNSKDCLQVVLCSKRCPQWCVPPLVDNDDDSSGTSFSPLIIALITILATAFLLIIYYFFISKYCKKRRDRERDHQTRALSADGPLEENLDRLIVLRSGLDNGSIESITVFKYKRGDGLVESTECAVCLSDFREGESLRLLPHCSHAFHIHCIDAWLKSNPNCPLCRANGDPFLPPPSRQVYMSNH